MQSAFTYPFIQVRNRLPESALDPRFVIVPDGKKISPDKQTLLFCCLSATHIEIHIVITLSDL